jgi:hypothetical protein
MIILTFSTKAILVGQNYFRTEVLPKYHLMAKSLFTRDEFAVTSVNALNASFSIIFINEVE